nr:trans-1,2-dihydrobenzene-1,2-diol dehydrogenase-like [Crassostrea gigas]
MVLRWGICGAGFICNDFVSALLAPPSSVHEVVCIGARSLARAQEFADRFGIKKAYGSYEEVASDHYVDVVYIGVIHIHHVKLSKQILKAGKNVLCEKPVAACLSQFLEVQQVAKDCKRFFMEVRGNFLSVVSLTVERNYIVFLVDQFLLPTIFHLKENLLK